MPRTLSTHLRPGKLQFAVHCVLPLHAASHRPGEPFVAAPPTQSRSLARARRSRIYLATVLDNWAAGASASRPCYPFLTPLKWRSPWHPRAVRAPLPCAAARLPLASWALDHPACSHNRPPRARRRSMAPRSMPPPPLSASAPAVCAFIVRARVRPEAPPGSAV